ncbi:hypothetical protein BJ165DRAFT_1411240 [Panaeolus papilionaceus]|nr:hypothetical protein BJ165DRAFT_1411240 [Panaeolus papilionaceus]
MDVDEDPGHVVLTVKTLWECEELLSVKRLAGAYHETQSRVYPFHNWLQSVPVVWIAPGVGWTEKTDSDRDMDGIEVIPMLEWIVRLIYYWVVESTWNEVLRKLVEWEH